MFKWLGYLFVMLQVINAWSSNASMVCSPYSDEVRKDQPLIYARFEESEEDQGLAIETRHGDVKGEFVKVNNAVSRGYSSRYSALGKNTLFRRDPRVYAYLNPQDAVSAGLDFAANQTITIEAWINPVQLGPYSQTIVSLDTAYGYKGYILSLEPNGALRFGRLNSKGVTTAINAIPNGTWSHVAIMIKPTSNQTLAMIYINSNPVLNQWATIDPMMPGSGANFYIGSRNLIAGDYSFVGSIDELAVYDKLLTPNDLARHYQAAVTSTLPPLTLGRAQTIIQQRGLQTQAWVLYTQGLDPKLWENIHLSTPVINPPELKTGVLQTLGKLQWGYKPPMKPLNQDQDLLSLDTDTLNRLISVQYGDEQDITNAQAQQDAYNYFQQMHQFLPNVLVHTNQSGLQLDESQLRQMVKATQPDIITLDTYFFDKIPYPGGNLNDLYNRLAKYRKIAMRGIDDSSSTPILFGHFAQGFLSKGGKMSESQVRAQLFASWTLGAKWLCLFWYNFLDSGGPSYLFGRFPDGNPLPGYNYYAQAIAESNALGRSLIYLHTTNVYFIPGQSMTNQVPVKNAIPLYGIYEWNDRVDAYLRSVEVRNLGNLNNSLPGDVMIGFFRPLVVNNSVLNDNYFMIFNGLTDYDGSANDTKQRISLTFDFSGTNYTQLMRLNRKTAVIEIVNLQALGNAKYKLDLDLEGGSGDLFKINNGQPFLISK